MSDSESSASGSDQEASGVSAGQHAPSGNIVSQVVDKINHQPFLFAIAVVVLLLGTLGQAGLPHYRFLIIVVALVIAIPLVGWYVVQVRRTNGSQAGQRAADTKFKAGLKAEKVGGKAGVLDAGEIGSGADVDVKADVKHIESTGDVTVAKVNKLGGFPQSSTQEGKPNKTPSE